MSETSIKTITACRSCDDSNLETVLDLGKQPLANALFNTKAEAEAANRYPLAIVACKSCGMFQLTYAPSPDVLFAGYTYQSSISSEFVSHTKTLCEQTIKRFKPNANDLIVEIGSNDGCLLKHYLDKGMSVLGIDPSEIASKIATQERGVETLCKFFNFALAEELADLGKQATIIHANNVMAHIPDIKNFLSALGRLLTQDGVVIIEVPYLGRLIDEMYFDTVYHEHVFYFSVTALDMAFRQEGLHIIDVEIVPIHGGSLRITGGRTDGFAKIRQPKSIVEEFKEKEATKLAVNGPLVQNFSKRVHNHVNAVSNTFSECFKMHDTVAAYGAAAKASVMLNALCPKHIKKLAYVVDLNTSKQDKFMAGVGAEIVGLDRLKAVMPGSIAIMPWNISNEIVADLRGILKPKTEILTCLPTISRKPLSSFF